MTGRWALAAAVAVALLLAPGSALAAGQPALESETVVLGGAGSATIEAEIEPGSDRTECDVQYVQEAAYETSRWATATSAPCPTPIVGGAGEQNVQVRLSGLAVATAYRYRVLASSEAGDTVGSGGSFSTFGIESFAFEALNEAGEPFVQAGGHPYELRTRMAFDTTHREDPWTGTFTPTMQDGIIRDIEVELPPGLIGNPDAVPKCPYATVEVKDCAPASQIGMIEIEEEGGIVRTAGLFNMVAPAGVAARFGARINAVANATIEAGVRSGGDYGINVDSLDITGFGTVTGLTVRMWGVPASPKHTPQRLCAKDPENENCAAEAAERPFLTMPTECASPLSVGLLADSYQATGDFAGAFSTMPQLGGCGSVQFNPQVSVSPGTTSADAPAGLRVGVAIPQDEELAATATPDLKEATLVFPKGLAVDPSSAAGLEGCSPQQIGVELSPDETQRVGLDPRLGGTFQLAFAGDSTASLPVEATAGEVQAALEALPSVGTGNVSVSGGAGGALIVRFTRALGGRSVPLLAGVVSRPAVQRLALDAVGSSTTDSAAYMDSVNLALDGQSTAATIEGTANVVAEGSERHVIGYIEDSSISMRQGTFVTGESISGPGLPANTMIRLRPGRIELVRRGSLSAYPTGAFRGSYEVSLPAIAFPGTFRKALEALPAIENVAVRGGPTGAYAGSDIASRFTILYEAAPGYQAKQVNVTPALEEMRPLKITPSYEAAGPRPLQISVVQAGGVPHFNGEPAGCPAASKLGSVEVITPLLDHPLPGALYLAAPHDNPFGSLIAVYLAVYDPISGVVVKLDGDVTLNQETGQVTVSFKQGPQLPFSELRTELFGAKEATSQSRAPLTTPETCGSYATIATLVPWSAPEAPTATPSSEPFQVAQGAAGGACAKVEAEAPNTPSFEAGTTNPVAGAYSPFVLKLRRKDGSQRFQGLDVTLPPGLTGKVAGIEECSQADIEAAEHRSAEGQGAIELEHPTCPPGSEVGAVRVGVGAGAPFSVTGRVYFAGPYHGAPFSLVIDTPAVAGPFDLGTVVVRAGIYVDPYSAQVTVKSDPFPTIRDGIPLDIRSLDIEITRDEFTLDPTSCEVMAVDGQEVSLAGKRVALSARFQAGGCGSMPFKPVFKASTSARHTRRHGASLKVRLLLGAGDANVAKVHVTLPEKLPAELETLKQACTEVQFAANPAGCPPGAFVGSAVVHTPILPVALTGSAIFVSHGGAGFPNLDLVLQGDGVTIVLVGETFISSKTGITTSTFPTVPDVPVSSFELNLPAGEHPALGGNGSFCRKPLFMPTTITGQNGALVSQRTRITVTGCRPEIRVVGHSVRGPRARIRVSVPAAGKLIASGRGVKRATRTAKEAGVVGIVVSLDRHDLRVLAQHPRQRVNAKVKLRFRLKHGRPLRTHLKLLLR